MNKKWIWVTVVVVGLVLLVSIVRAGDKSNAPGIIQVTSSYPSLNRVHYIVQKEQWVASDSARVVVAVNANLTDAALDHFQDDMNKNLATLAKNVSWHLTQFNRNQDSSGLEQVSAVAEARIPNSALAALRAKAEKLSQPGTKYAIVDIQYGPSDEDIQKAKAALRQQMYTAIDDEISRLNKLYKQHFFVNSIDFDLTPAPGPMPIATMARMEVNAGNDASIPVNQKLVLQADVVLAAKV